jgi:UDP-2,3-diacylglucosamine pyrophosphatase LpxH
LQVPDNPEAPAIMNTLIVSDIHLGSRNSRAPLLSRFLTAVAFDRLILNGDTINNLNLKKLKPKHWRLLDQLRDVARRRDLILIRGNHDGAHSEEKTFGPLDVLATLLGVPLNEEYPLDVGADRYLVLHGDRFDPTLNWPALTDAADWCYHGVQKLNKKAARWLKRRVKRLGGVVEFVKQRSVEYARKRDCKGIVTGHTHFPDDEWVAGVHYLNTGCWVDSPCNYVYADRSGIRLMHWDEPEHEGNEPALPVGVNGYHVMGEKPSESQEREQTDEALLPSA